MEIEVELGKSYLTISGQKVIIERKVRSRYAFIGSNGERYMHNGKWSPYADSEKDLVVIIEK